MITAIYAINCDFSRQQFQKAYFSLIHDFKQVDFLIELLIVVIVTFNGSQTVMMLSTERRTGFRALKKVIPEQVPDNISVSVPHLSLPQIRSIMISGVLYNRYLPILLPFGFGSRRIKNCLLSCLTGADDILYTATISSFLSDLTND